MKRAEVTQKVIDLLKINIPMTSSDMAHALSIDRRRINMSLQDLMGTPKKVYVVDWRSAKYGKRAPMYLLGNLKDVPEPPLKSATQRSVAFRARMEESRVREYKEFSPRKPVEVKLPTTPATPWSGLL